MPVTIYNVSLLPLEVVSQDSNHRYCILMPGVKGATVFFHESIFTFSWLRLAFFSEAACCCYRKQTLKFSWQGCISKTLLAAQRQCSYANINFSLQGKGYCQSKRARLNYEETTPYGFSLSLQGSCFMGLTLLYFLPRYQQHVFRCCIITPVLPSWENLYSQYNSH